ncbi:MAG TPA: C4-type zinc ribbon domain-containing protein [Tepidisphaeraceae bacterium]|jgi:hypothetical protein|nr:C4-type zinc ribbon domain-containing protein [Tepidisphaeraceae bacterium]
MGPTNVALVKLFHNDQALREAQGRLDAASKNVRIQERKVSDLAEKLKLAQTKLRELQAKGGQFELDVKTREARIEKLRLQQQNANNNKEYQAFLIEISTEKVDRSKAEDELLKVMEAIEAGQAEVKEHTAHHETESQNLATMRAQIGDRVAKLRGETDALRPARDAAAEAVPARHRQIFERLAERYEGEALSALAKPDRRREEYLCSACNMDLVADVYNRLHSRDDLIFCTSCGRILYIPEDLPPEVAVNTRGKHSSAEKGAYGAAAPKTKRAAKVVEKLDPAERRAKGKLGDLLAGAQGESVKITLDAGEKPVECEVTVDGKARGIYKGKSAEHLQRIISLRMEEAGVKGTVQVNEKSAEAENSAASPETAPAQVSSETEPPTSEPASGAISEHSEQPAS